MARTIHKLKNEAAIRAKPPGVHCDGAGLYIAIRTTKTRGRSYSWLFRYSVNGVKREMGLGTFPTVGIADARELARDAAKLVSQGIDPIGAREAARLASQKAAVRRIAFREAADRARETRLPTWRGEAAAEAWDHTMSRFVLPTIGDMACADVTRDHIAAVLRPIWHAKPETAARTRNRIQTVLEWAAVHEGEDERANPARLSLMKKLLGPQVKRAKRVKHHDALAFEHAPAFMRDLETWPQRQARALELLILTATRCNEVRGARRCEFDMAKALWRIPGERMKGAKPHTIPLSPQAAAIVRALLETTPDRPDALLFPGRIAGRPIVSILNFMNQTMRRNDITVHGFRSTFRDWAGEGTRHESDICEAALAHAGHAGARDTALAALALPLGGDVQLAYQRGTLLEKRRLLMNEWAQFVRPISNVVEFRAA